MNILHIIDKIGVGGAEILLLNSLSSLQDETNIICSLTEPQSLQSEFEKKGKFYCLYYEGYQDILSTIKKIRVIIKENKIDIVHSHLIRSSWFAKIACGRRVPLIFTIHNKLSEDAFQVNRLSLYMERLTYSKKHTIIAVSGDSLNDYKKFIKIGKKAYVLHNFIADEFFITNYKPQFTGSNQLRLVAVGNLRRQKNYATLLKAFRLLKTFPITLDIYGVGDISDDLQKLITAYGLNVSLKGKGEKMHEILKNYDAYIMASTFEGFGIAPMEAMAVGMPLLLSDIDVFKEIAENQPIYFDPNSEEDIAEKILWSFHNWNEFVNLSKSNKKFAYKKTSRKEYIKKLKHIYRKTITQQI